jgi:hypothetical protein
MNVAATDRAPPRRIDDKKIKKKLPCPAVPRRGPEAGIHHILAMFMIPV